MGDALSALKGIAGASQGMKAVASDVQKALELARVEGIAGAGLVRVQFTGLRKCESVMIDPSLLSKAQVAQDLLRTAINDGLEKVAEEEMRQQQKLMTAMMGELPAMMAKFGGGVRKPGGGDPLR